MLPHPGVHSGSNHNRRRYGQMECGQKVVGQTGRQTCDAVGGRGGDKEESDGLSNENMIESAFEVASGLGTFEHLNIDFVTGQRLERQRGYKLRGTPGHENGYVNTTILEPSDDLGCLVARYTTGDANCDFHSSCSFSSLSVFWSGIRNFTRPPRISFCAT